LLRLTTEQEYRIQISTRIGSAKYELSTRLVITPHFSYDYNFYPQFRLSPDAWKAFAEKYPAAAKFLSTDPRLSFQQLAGAFVAAGFPPNAGGALKDFETSFTEAYRELTPTFYDPHNQMAGVLADLFNSGELAWTQSDGQQPGYLTRGNGPCQFCENSHWKFPLGCPYGKPTETPYPLGFLEQVAAKAVSGGTG
jgi:hypothetical protein